MRKHQTTIYFKQIIKLVLLICLFPILSMHLRAENSAKGSLTDKKVIQGKILDESGQPLPYVAVQIKNTTLGTISDYKGAFSIQISDKPDQILLISSLGFQTQEINIGDEEYFEIVLLETIKDLEEILVTGYQTLTKERATGSFNTVNKEDLNNKLHVDLSKAIEGLASGLNINNEGKINIRGHATFEAEQEPLIIVDGFIFENDINTINTDNIDNITILKDAVAASIYGARSANGVIVITTKEGKTGKLNLSYKGVLSITQKTDIDDMNLNSTSGFIDAQMAIFNDKPGFFNSSTYRMSHVYTSLMKAHQGLITQEEAITDINKLRQYNIYEEIADKALRNRFTQQHNINMSGGSDKNTYNISLNYFDENGHELRNEKQRFLFDIKNVWKPKKGVKLMTAVNMIYKKDESSNTNFTNMLNSIGHVGQLQPYDRLTNDDGDFVKNIPFYTSEIRSNVYENHNNMKPWHYNPMHDYKESLNESNDLQLRLSAQLNLDLYKGLNFMIGGAWTRGNMNTKNYYSAKSFLMRTAFNDATSVTDPIKHYIPEGGLLDESRNYNESYTFRTQLNFHRSFNNDKHLIKAIVGNEISRTQFDKSKLPTKLGYNPVSGDYIFTDNINVRAGGAFNSDYLFGRWDSFLPNISTGNFDYRDNRFVSWYGNGSYEYDERFIISGSMRLDLTNFFGTDPDYRYKPIWSVGGTYKLSNEDWFTSSLINRLNLRASYGINGNISMNEGPFMILSSNGYSLNAQGIAYEIKSPANDQLRWEKTKTYNLGVDLAVLKNRLNITFDIYQKKSTDLLAPDAIDPTSGVTDLYKNVGKIKNNGLELTIDSKIVKSEYFNYRTIINSSYNKNKVQEYNMNRPYPSNYLWPYGSYGLNVADYAMESLWGFRGAPLSNEGEARAYDKDQNIISPNALTVDDLVCLGSAIPKLNLSWMNQFDYKDFQLSFMFVGSFGAKFWDESYAGARNVNLANNKVAQAWKKPGDEKSTIYPKLTYFGAGGFWYNKAHYYIKDADFIKLREVTLAYHLPKNVLSLIGVNQAKIYIQGRNLFTFKAEGVEVDPETRGLPLNKEFYAGLSLSF